MISSLSFKNVFF